MRNLHYLNTVIYFAIVALYIYNSILGVLGQFGLGIFQLIVAIRISLEAESLTQKKYIKYYWICILVWVVLIITVNTASTLESYLKLILFVLPMLIGFYFVIVTYLIQNKQSDES